MKMELLSVSITCFRCMKIMFLSVACFMMVYMFYEQCFGVCNWYLVLRKMRLLWMPRFIVWRNPKCLEWLWYWAMVASRELKMILGYGGEPWVENDIGLLTVGRGGMAMFWAVDGGPRVYGYVLGCWRWAEGVWLILELDGTLLWFVFTSLCLIRRFTFEVAIYIECMFYNWCDGLIAAWWWY